jgi:ABC-type antimicrobial peptide transport system permease subunit
MEWEGKDPQSKQIVERYFVDENFARTAGLTLIAGRDMDLSKYPSDSTAVLLNESAVRMMAFDDPIGEIIKDGNIDWHVIGVIKDFVLSSPYHKIIPMALMGSRGWFEVIHIRLNPGKPVPDAVAGIESVFRKYNPEYPFSFQFVDDVYHKKFKSLEKTLTITTVFASLVIFISCLGLLGLSTYLIESRTKEIGVRKVLGGTVLGITRLLCFATLKPIFIAILIFSPVSWLAMNWWLQFSEYRVSLDPGVLLISWGAIVLISLLTVSAQTVRAAMVNPVDSLKSE